MLDATTTLYNAKQELANARYNYLINQLNIKSALGTLNEQDLLALNNALSKPVSTNPENVARKRRNRMLLLMVMRLIAGPRRSANIRTHYHQ
ncbi:outer membrane channel protein [Escherichia coli]|uniref:Outer membrane channel protein n=1 Tax=Escherichia coli TaxID=562 RepID=A0A2X1LCJ6_ECOLX|nr:outer membrane channel protein [Escherichia coli]